MSLTPSNSAPQDPANLEDQLVSRAKRHNGARRKSAAVAPSPNPTSNQLQLQHPTSPQPTSNQPQPTSNQPQPTSNPTPLHLSEDQIADMLTAADATIAELAQLSTGLGFQKGVELSQALNTFPEAIAQGFAHHQQATMGGHMSGLEGFRRRLAEITASHSAPALPTSQPMALLEGAGADPESLQD